MDVTLREPVGNLAVFFEDKREGHVVSAAGMRGILAACEEAFVAGFGAMNDSPEYVMALYELEIHTEVEWLLLRCGGFDMDAAARRGVDRLPPWLLRDLVRDMRRAAETERDDAVPLSIALGLYGVRDAISHVIAARDPAG
jgi:hypothetical protein